MDLSTHRELQVCDYRTIRRLFLVLCFRLLQWDENCQDRRGTTPTFQCIYSHPIATHAIYSPNPTQPDANPRQKLPSKDAPFPLVVTTPSPPLHSPEYLVFPPCRDHPHYSRVFPSHHPVSSSSRPPSTFPISSALFLDLLLFLCFLSLDDGFRPRGLRCGIAGVDLLLSSVPYWI